MRKLLLLVTAAFMIAGCKKDNSTQISSKKAVIVSVLPTVNSTEGDDWKQILGGRGLIAFNYVASDSLTASNFKDSLNLKDAATYKKSIVAGKYDVSLTVSSKAVADTFIRFNALTKSYLVNKDQTISLPGITTDGVITIKKSLIQTATIPSFIDSKTLVSYTFGVANGYYFLYTNSGTTGRLSFTEATTGDVFIKDITVKAANRYDIAVALNKTNSVNVIAMPFVKTGKYQTIN